MTQLEGCPGEEVAEAWLALRERCCSDPPNAKRCVMVAEEDFIAAVQPLVSTLSAEREAMEGALKPFADEADAWTDTLPDDYRPAVLEAAAYEPGMAGDLARFTLGDLRRARSLQHKGETDEQAPDDAEA